jgi:hypothetical protein
VASRGADLARCSATAAAPAARAKSALVHQITLFTVDPACEMPATNVVAGDAQPQTEGAVAKSSPVDAAAHDEIRAVHSTPAKQDPAGKNQRMAAADDDTGEKGQRVKKVQWFDETSGVGKEVRGKRVLIMDEVDDTRTTLKYCVEEVMKTNAPAAIAVAVVHNKLKPKEVRSRRRPASPCAQQQHLPLPPLLPRPAFSPRLDRPSLHTDPPSSSPAPLPPIRLHSRHRRPWPASRRVKIQLHRRLRWQAPLPPFQEEGTRTGSFAA